MLLHGMGRLSDVEGQLNRYLEDGVPKGVMMAVRGISDL